MLVSILILLYYEHFWGRISLILREENKKNHLSGLISLFSRLILEFSRLTSEFS
jgi:hypothetical protein